MGKYCENCGQELNEKAKFCPKCGKKIVIDIQSEINNEDKLTEWEEIYKKTYAKAYAVAIQIVKNKEDAKDILQESYIAAFNSMDSIRDKSKTGAWINKIVANRCKDWLKKKNPMLFSDLKNDEDADMEFEDNIENDKQEFMPEESVDYEDTKKIMQEILFKLSDEQRLCILMYYYDEMSVNEIAETLECSTGTIKSRLNYARKYIKAEVEELEKKGTKLYGIVPLPFIVWMLASQEGTITAEAAEMNSMKDLEEVFARKDNKINEKDVIKENAKSNIGQEAVKRSGKAVGNHVVKKIVAAVVGTAVIGTSGYFAATKMNEKNSEKSKSINKKQQVTKNSEGKNENNKLEELIQEIDYDYLAKMCTYLPAYSSIDQLTDDELASIYSLAFGFYFEDHYCEKYHSSSEYVDTYGEKEHGTSDFYSFNAREIISDDQEIKEENKQITFKGTALDKFNEIAGITKDTKELSLGYVTYDGENYVGDLGDGLDNTVECSIVDKGFDTEDNKIIVNIEKKELNSYDALGEETNEENQESITYETIEISPADNSYGYKIDKISGGKSRLEKDMNIIEDELEKNSDEVLEIASILGNYNAKKADSMETMKKIGDGMAIRYVQDTDRILELNKSYQNSIDSDTKYFDGNKFIEVCELAGISTREAEQGYVGAVSSSSGYLYSSSYSYDSNYTATATYFLRTEADDKTNKVKVYFLSVDAKGNGEFDNFQKGTIELEPCFGLCGYQINTIKMEEWNDGYSADMLDIEREAYNKADYGDSVIARDITSAVNQSVDYWEEQVESFLTRIESKYPKEKEKLEKQQKEYEADVEKQIEAENEENERADMMGNSLMSPGRVAASVIRLNAAQKRAYYLVGNFLMDNKTEILDK